MKNGGPSNINISRLSFSNGQSVSSEPVFVKVLRRSVMAPSSSHIIRVNFRCLREALLQDFVVRNDMPCGSTIGPILASGVGIRTVDVGAPQWSMHSIREMCAVDDMKHSYEHFKAFFQDFSQLDGKIAVDI